MLLTVLERSTTSGASGKYPTRSMKFCGITQNWFDGRMKDIDNTADVLLRWADTQNATLAGVQSFSRERTAPWMRCGIRKVPAGKTITGSTGAVRQRRRGLSSLSFRLLLPTEAAFRKGEIHYGQKSSHHVSGHILVRLG
jgi:hypothetical protein